MALSSSPTGCKGCQDLSRRVADLETRLSALFESDAQHRSLESVVRLGPCLNPFSVNLDATVQADQKGPPSDPAMTQFSDMERKATSTPLSSDHETAKTRSKLYHTQGARPKPGIKRSATAIYTPNPNRVDSVNASSPFIEVRHKRRKKSPSLPQDLQLSNKFDILSEEDFPPLQAPALRCNAYSDPSSNSSPLMTLKARRNIAKEPAFRVECINGPLTVAKHTSTPDPYPAAVNLSAQRLDPAAPSQSQPGPEGPRPLFAPVTAIIGDSIIRKIRFFNAKTCCFPGATGLMMYRVVDLSY
ncbi:hypothetical protein WMY93_019564 [Mugilogobius chulae]|uniref:Uncharacterized protein n=1 Tax=Mugilogobius chulae TaxID=88201 RepID=A0AAW0NES0_9GOBI